MTFLVILLLMSVFTGGLSTPLLILIFGAMAIAHPPRKGTWLGFKPEDKIDWAIYIFWGVIGIFIIAKVELEERAASTSTPSHFDSELGIAIIVLVTAITVITFGAFFALKGVARLCDRSRF